MLCPVLFGRDKERSVLVGKVDGATEGVGGLVGVVGEAGVGKTRLCRVVGEYAAEHNMTVLGGRAVPGPSPVPYRPLTEALAGAFRSSRPPATPELRGFGGQLGRLVPDWRTDRTGGADESPVLLAEAAVRLLRVIAGQKGCVLILEDLHWADAETLAVVEYLADALRSERVLTVCSARPHGAATDLLARLQRRQPMSVVGINPLGDDDVERIVAACLSTDDPPREVLGLVNSHSDGNPFLVEELLAGLVASGALYLEDGRWVTSNELTATVPFSFADSIRQRLTALNVTARRVLSAAAVLGRRFDWELLPGVADVDGQAVVDSLRRGIEEQLVEVEGSGFKFRHALTREAVLNELLPPERRELSSRAWPAVERANPGLPGPWCELAAELAEASGRLTEAATRLLESASRALASGAFTSAEGTARRAIRLAVENPVVANDAKEVLVQTLALAGKPQEAMTIGLPLIEQLTDQAAPADRRAGLLIVLARAAIAAGDKEAANTMSGRARQLVDGGEVDEATAARVQAVAAHVALAHDQLAEADALARSAAERAAGAAQPAVECEALEVIGRVARTRSADGGREWFERGAGLAERHGLTTWLLRARHELALQDWVNGRKQPLLETRELAARHGALVTVAVLDLALADFGLSGFDRDACLEAAQRCVAASRRYGLATLPVAELWLAGAYALAGRDPEMDAAAERALEPNPDDPRILGDLWGRVRATRAIVRNDREELWTCLDKQMDYARVAPVSTSLFPNRVMWAMLHTIHDDDCGKAARDELADATNLRAYPGFEAANEMLAAIADGRAGRIDVAAARFAAASRERRSLQFARGVIEYQHILVAEAAIRDGWGDPAAWLRGTEAFFANAGYDAIARACRLLLAKAGAPVPRRGRGDSVVPTALRALGITSREMDVLKLVADGLSNREIGERLFLSPKTVERHVASLFGRTGLGNRRDLARFARSQTG